MNDMTPVIAPKSDQLNADSLLTGPITITVTNVTIRPGTEQPISIHYDGENGRPYKCCKSMARVLVAMWGADASQYVGRSMTLYCDPTVKWAGMEVGGIRISHMSHIDREHTMALTASKGNRKPFKVLPLAVAESKTKPTIDTTTLTVHGRTAALLGETPEQRNASLAAWWKDLSKPEQAVMKPILDKELKPIAVSGVAPAAESNY
jgi:hypothetical protein